MLENLEAILESILSKKHSYKKQTWFDEGLLENNNHYKKDIMYDLQYYPFFQLNDFLKTLLKKKSIKVEQELIIEEAQLSWKDIVISIKYLFEENREWFSSIKELAQKVYEIVSQSTYDYIQSVSLEGIFINIILSNKYYQAVLKTLHNAQDEYGNVNFLNSTDVVMEFSSPNISKQMTIGHLRSTIIGAAMTNILAKSWANVYRWNYLGDWGTNFGKIAYSLCYQYQQWQIQGIIKSLKRDPISTLEQLYAGFKDIPNEKKEDEARYVFHLLEMWDEATFELWKIIKYYSLIDFQQVYKRLWVEFDLEYGESYTQSILEDIIKDIDDKNYLVSDQDAKIVYYVKKSDYKGTLKHDAAYYPLQKDEISWYEKDQLQVMVFEKKDGSTLYSTRDIASIFYRTQKLHKTVIYLEAGNEQYLHFLLVFTLAAALGYIDHNNINHIGHGLFLLGGEKMSSRKWNVHRLAELLDIIQENIFEEFGEKIDKWIAGKLSVSALVFNELKNDRQKDIEFNIENMTRLQWDTWTYIQYAMVRLQSLLAQLWNVEEEFADEIIAQEQSILKLLGFMPYVLKKSLEAQKPHLMAQHLLQIMREFNSYYTTGPKVLQLDDQEQSQKKYILQCLYFWIKSYFDLLLLPVVEKM